MKKIWSSILLLVLCFGMFSSARGAEIIVYADSVFDSASASLSSTKKVIFDVATVRDCGSIKISSCQLEQKVNGIWKSAGTLTAPSAVANNASSLTTSANYSTDIGSGTFRIKVGFTADNYTIYRYSNERTY